VAGHEQPLIAELEGNTRALRDEAPGIFQDQVKLPVTPWKPREACFMTHLMTRVSL
jgi:hypothetical protein